MPKCPIFLPVAGLAYDMWISTLRTISKGLETHIYTKFVDGRKFNNDAKIISNILKKQYMVW